MLPLRQLLKNPGFTAVAVVTLAVGIGANTVVFSVARTVLFRPVGFDGEDRLLWLRLNHASTGTSEDQFSWQDMEDIRGGARSFESVATFGSQGMVWADGDSSEEVSVLRVTPDLLEALRLRPALGRMITATDATPAAEPVVLISHDLWQSHFGGGPNVIGQTVRLDGRSCAIVGVLPAALQFPLARVSVPGEGTAWQAGRHWFWMPMLAPKSEDRNSRSARMFPTVARLKPGVTEKVARSELAALSRRLAVEFPDSNRQWNFDLVSFRDQILGRARQGIPLLAAAVAAVLLICCVNLANLLLARGVNRQRDFAVRLALGSGRRRLVQEQLMESLLLSLLGGLLGLGLAQASLQLMGHLAASSVPYMDEATVNMGTAAFTAGISIATAVAFGLWPALWLSRGHAAEVLHTGTRSTLGRPVRRWQQGLLVGQIAVVLVLLASAGLLLESFRRLTGQHLGYQPQQVVTLDLETPGFKTNGDVCRFYRELWRQLTTLPGVDSVGTISSAPLTSKWTFYERPQIIGQAVPLADRPSVAATFVAFDYFQAMGIPLQSGRFFREDELDDNGYGRRVLLNQTAANLMFPGRPAVGGQFTVGSNPDRVLEVIGVVADTRDVRLEEKPLARFYWQYAFGGAQVVVRGKIPAAPLLPALRQTVLQTDPRVRIESIRPMTDFIASAVAQRRFLLTLVMAYAVVALGIASMGIFGVIAYQVAKRRNEFGVRLALGASPSTLLRFVLVEAGSLVLLGLTIGVGLSLASNQLLRNQLFGISPHDPTLLTVVSLIVFLIGLLASFLPARRAARTNPMEALRHE